MKFKTKCVLTVFFPPDSDIPAKKRYPYFFACPLEPQSKIPSSVSLVLKACDQAENNLQIINNQPVDGIKKKFGVCTKQLNFLNRNIVIRFIEWIHMLRILGVEKVHGYSRFVHPDLQKAIENFEAKGFLEIKPFMEPSTTLYQLQTAQTRTLELNLLHDCFYRNKGLYKYIAVLDTDEIFMPTNDDLNWHDMIGRIDNADSFDHFYIPYAYFSSDESLQTNIPASLYMLQHVEVKFVLKVFYRNSFKNLFLAFQLVRIRRTSILLL
jgi:Glycosyltransferase family 92